MNETARLKLNVIVERVVRPVHASLANLPMIWAISPTFIL